MRTAVFFLIGLANFAAACVGSLAYAADPALSYAPQAHAMPEIALHSPKALPEPPHGRVCFNQAETRERIIAHKLAEPFQALETGNQEGDALRAKLCRWEKDEFVYEIAVLREDGRIIHVYMDAQSGRTVKP